MIINEVRCERTSSPTSSTVSAANYPPRRAESQSLVLFVTVTGMTSSPVGTRVNKQQTSTFNFDRRVKGQTAPTLVNSQRLTHFFWLGQYQNHVEPVKCSGSSGDSGSHCLYLGFVFFLVSLCVNRFLTHKHTFTLTLRMKSFSTRLKSGTQWILSAIWGQQISGRDTTSQPLRGKPEGQT